MSVNVLQCCNLMICPASANEFPCCALWRMPWAPARRRRWQWRRWGPLRVLKAVEGLLWASGKCMFMTVCWKKSEGREVNGWSEARRCVAIASFFECRAAGLKLFGKFCKLSSDCTCLYWPSWWGCQNDCQSSSGIASRAHPEGHGNHRAPGFFAASTDHVRGATHSDRDVLMLQHATRSHQMLQTVFVSLLLEDALTSSQSSKTALEVDCSVHLSLDVLSFLLDPFGRAASWWAFGIQSISAQLRPKAGLQNLRERVVTLVQNHQAGFAQLDQFCGRNWPFVGTCPSPCFILHSFSSSWCPGWDGCGRRQGLDLVTL